MHFNQNPLPQRYHGAWTNADFGERPRVRLFAHPSDPNQHPASPLKPACAQEQSPIRDLRTELLRSLKHQSRHTCDADSGHCESAA